MEDKFGNTVIPVAELTHNGFSTGLLRCTVIHAPGTEQQATRSRVLREEDIAGMIPNVPFEPVDDHEYEIALSEADA